MSPTPPHSPETQPSQTSLFGDAVPLGQSRQAPAKAKKVANSPLQTSKSPPPPPPLVEPRTHPYTVGELTAIIKDTFKEDPILGTTLLVEGEISNLSPSSRGHVYFQLKDEQASIKGVIWASAASKLPFTLENGMAVTVTGTVDVYAPNGTYSLVTRRIEPVGIGPLQLAFLQLKEKLTAEGLFDPSLKQPVPVMPKRVGMVTARTGAVIHDMLRVLYRKNPLIDVILAPVSVQGQGAATSIAHAINQLNDPRLGLDVLIVGRGGGSFEDLFCFSEEPVVRAIVGSRLPVITGVGHEPDFSLADAAADLTCSTPTAAAEAVTLDLLAIRDTLIHYRSTLIERIEDRLSEAEQRLDLAGTAFTDGLQYAIERAEQQLDGVSHQLAQWGHHLLERPDAYLSKLASELHAYSPLKTLSRGYSMAINPISDTVVTSVNQIQAGQPLAIHVKDGHINTVVVSNNPTVLKEPHFKPNKGEAP